MDAARIAPDALALLDAPSASASPSRARAGAPSLAGARPTAARARPSARTAALCDEARQLLIETASPAGVWQEISGREFASVYNGEGKNAARTPLEAVFPRAAHLALFAVTLGPAVTERIGALFAARDFALAALLDAACSEGAERAADELEARYEEHLRAEGAGASENRHLRYSPGYCGWHVSGQRALFAALQPGDVGLTLRESCLMEPLKSISGVIVAGPAAIHDFTDDFEFCTDCAERACRSRIRRILDA